MENCEENPFKLPSDQDVFLNRIRNKKQNEEKQRLKKKNRTSTKLPPFGDQNEPRLLGERRRERENISDFIRKKREMFLLQMSLDTKRAEISKLQEKAQNREHALFKAEVMLEEDATRFEQFLRDNDNKCNEAMEKHDREAKAKQEKAQQIKRMNQEISKIKLEIEKYNDALADCMKYQNFLDSLTPSSWFEEQKKKMSTDNKTEKLEEQVDDMYFTDPQQLCDIFSALEKKNLFLIQNVQEIEEQVDDLKQEFKLQKKERSGKTRLIEDNIKVIQSKIEAQERKQERLRMQVRILKQNDGGDRENLLRELAKKVEQVVRECGFAPEQAPTTLEQLQKIEEHNEMLISLLDEMPEDKRKAAEKKAENDRRLKLRKEKLRQQEENQKRRLALQLERAKRVEEHVRKNKKGKPVMFRSAPPKAKKVSKNALQKKKEEDEALRKKFFT